MTWKSAIILAAVLLMGCSGPVEERHVDLDRMTRVWERMEERTAAESWVRKNARPTPLPPGEHSVVCKRPEPNTPTVELLPWKAGYFTPGTRVEILRGAFKGVVGVVTSFDERMEVATVEFTAPSRVVKLDFDYFAIEKTKRSE